MKLIFPNGEHAQALLSEGVNRIGSAPDAHVSLKKADIAPLHCELQLAGGNVTLRVPDPTHPVMLNGKVVQGVLTVRAGDQIGIGSVTAKLVATEAANRSAADLDSDTGATRMRMAVPKYVLRGVSGPAFGKTFPVPGPLVIGRAPECDISITSEEISRRHAQVKPIQDGLAVDDLGSANGTYINGQRVQHGLLKPGDELRLDAIRFLLVAPGMDLGAAQRPTAQLPLPKQGGNKAALIGALVAAAAAAAGAAWYFLGG